MTAKDLKRFQYLGHLIRQSLPTAAEKTEYQLLKDMDMAETKLRLHRDRHPTASGPVFDLPYKE